jgi:hypothetical protein
MPLVGLEPTIPAFDRATTVHASDRGVTVISLMELYEGRLYTEIGHSILKFRTQVWEIRIESP